MDKWLSNLKKTTVDTLTLPDYKAAAPNVDGQFADMVKISDDDEASDADIPDPVGLSIKATSDERNRIPEFAEPEAPHADGEEIEKSGTETWTRTYAGGELVKSFVVDPALPGRQMFFDARSHEITRAEYLAIKECEPQPVYVSEGIAQILGVADLEG